MAGKADAVAVEEDEVILVVKVSRDALRDDDDALPQVQGPAALVTGEDAETGLYDSLPGGLLRCNTRQIPIPTGRPYFS